MVNPITTNWRGWDPRPTPRTGSSSLGPRPLSMWLRGSSHQAVGSIFPPLRRRLVLQAWLMECSSCRGRGRWGRCLAASSSILGTLLLPREQVCKRLPSDAGPSGARPPLTANTEAPAAEEAIWDPPAARELYSTWESPGDTWRRIPPLNAADPWNYEK